MNAEERAAAHEARIAWVAGLKVGDKVALGGFNKLISKVVRFTPKRVVLSNGVQIVKDTARTLGSWIVEPYTPAIDELIKQQRLNSEHRSAMGRITNKLNDMTIAQLAQVQAFVVTLKIRRRRA